MRLLSIGEGKMDKCASRLLPVAEGWLRLHLGPTHFAGSGRALKPRRGADFSPRVVILLLITATGDVIRCFGDGLLRNTALPAKERSEPRPIFPIG